jgi:trimeric autotransporter adhesin
MKRNPLGEPAGKGGRRVTAIAGGLAATAMLLACSACNGFFVDPVLTSVQVGPAGATVLVKATQQYEATGTYDDGSTRALSSIVWSASPVTVATIDSSGVATGVSAGTVTITASSGTVSGTVTMTVQTAPLQSITVTPSNPSVSLSSGPTLQFTATGVYTDGSKQDITSSVTWNSTKVTTATVNSSGLATAVGVGTTSIQASSGTIVGFTTMSVSN